MLRTSLSVILVVSIFFWVGCYDLVTLPREDYGSVNQYTEVNVLTDSAGVVKKYRFSKGMCVVQKDTLIGTGTKMSAIGEEEGVAVNIPTSKISVVEVKKLNVPTSLALAGVVVAATVGAIFIIGIPGASGEPGSQPPTPQ